MKNKKILKFITIDFDGTCVDHCFPDIGRPAPGAFDWMKRFKELGATLILLTMRSDRPQDSRKYLTEAVEFCRQYGVEFDYVNEPHKSQKNWTDSRKIYSHIHIDDTNACCPLVDMGGKHGVVDWSVVGPWVESQLLLGKETNPVTATVDYDPAK